MVFGFLVNVLKNCCVIGVEFFNSRFVRIIFGERLCMLMLFRFVLIINDLVYLVFNNKKGYRIEINSVNKLYVLVGLVKFICRLSCLVLRVLKVCLDILMFISEL